MSAAVTVLVKGHFMAGGMSAPDRMLVSFWALDGLCGLHIAANDNLMLRPVPAPSTPDTLGEKP